jgi:hypothetical protein
MGETLFDPLLATRAKSPLGAIAMPYGCVPTVKSVPLVGTIGFDKLMGETLFDP